MMLAVEIIVAIIVIAILAAIAINIPDIARYIRISRM
jgi:cytosine/uracil/thiamine/allantoin permease